MDRTFTTARLLLDRVLSPERLESRAAFLQTQAPVILMGRGKSGTRLMAWACSHLGLSLGTTPRLPAGDLDHQGFREVCKRLARRNLDVAEPEQVRPRELALFQKAAYEACRWLRFNDPQGVGWGWKWPETYLLMPYVFRTFPQARYVHMVRDGRDVAFKRHSTDDPERPLGRMLIDHLGVAGQPRDIQAAASWEFQVRRYLSFADAHVPAAQRFEMTYEQFCSKPEETMEQLARFLGIPMTDACRHYVHDTLTDGQIAQYRNADPARVQAVEARIAPLLQQLGYRLEAG